MIHTRAMVHGTVMAHMTNERLYNFAVPSEANATRSPAENQLESESFENKVGVVVLPRG